jgi:hypothetical protein
MNDEVKPVSVALDVNAIMEAAREEVTTSLVNDVKRQLTYTVGQQLAAEITPVVREFVKAQIVPELQALLLEQKGVILAAAAEAATVIGQGVAEKLVKQASETLASSYTRGKVIDAIFGKS